MTKSSLTVVIPTYNPRMDYLERVLAALRAQTQPTETWDLLIVDNNSAPPLAGRIDVSWHARAGVIAEPTPGKMHAQVAAFRRSQSDLILILDDDTVPAPNYLELCLQIAAGFPMIGAWSSRVELEFEDPGLVPPARLRHLLAERLVDKLMWSNDPNHTPSTPWGCGMCIRRAVADAYVRQTVENPKRLQLDPMGDQPGYGGDTDMAYTGCSIGLGMGVFPQLLITHLIPRRRCTHEYLIRNLEAHSYSHMMHAWTYSGSPPPAPDLRGYVSRWLKWLSTDALGREIMAAEQRSRAAVLRTLATGTDSRPVTHR